MQDHEIETTVIKMDKKTYWKDGYQLIDNSGHVYTVKGKRAYCRDLGKLTDGFIEEEEYDENLKLIHRFQRGDKYDIVAVKMPGELFFEEWNGKPVAGKAWDDSDGYKHNVTIIGHCRGQWVCENVNMCLQRFDHVAVEQGDE